MKITRSSKQIYGAEFDIGTTYYTATLDDVLKSVENDNKFLYYGLQLEGFDILSRDAMYGSAVIDDVLYICVTNGKDINVDGEMVDPEKALYEYENDISVLSAYIQEADDKIISKNISTYELDLKKLKDLAEDIAIAAIEDGTKFDQLVNDWEEIKF